MRVFDLHCDTLTLCKRQGWDLDGGGNQLRLSDAADFDGYIQLYAVFIPDEIRGEAAMRYFGAHHAYYRRQIEASGGRLRDVGTLQTLRQAKDRAGMSGILAVENGSVLGGRIDETITLANAGVRSLTLTWNGQNEIAGGADSDGRLTAFGRDVVRQLERLRIAIDVSHLNDKSLDDVFEATDAPVIATHSNSRAVCAHRRNLTDGQFQEIARRGGLAGLNYARHFIAEKDGDAGLQALARHVLHFLELGGEDAVALGSDYDGADIPGCINQPRAQRKLYQTLLEAGVSVQQAEKLFFSNAYRFFERLFAGPAA